jgi:hypothetical protein
VGETDVEGNHFKMGVDDWDIIGQCTSSLMTVTTVVKQEEGDTEYPTSSLVLSFMNSGMRSLSEDDPINQTWLGTGNVSREFSVSSVYVCVQYVRQNIREDMEDRWVTNLNEKTRFYLVSSLLDPHTKMLSFCDNKYFPSSWKDDVPGYLSMDLKSFYVQRTQGEVKDSDGQVKHRSALDELVNSWYEYRIHGFRRGLCRRGSPASSVHTSPTGVQRHRPSDVVEAASARVSRLGPNDQTVHDSTYHFYVS